MKVPRAINKIQTFLDLCQYNKRDFARSAQRVKEEKIAHCLEGALYAAWQLEQLKVTPYLLDFRAIADDDHVVCVYQWKQYWGAIGKSSTSLLRGRDPIFATVEKLVLSYFPFYFNKRGKMSLYQWCGPIPMKYFKNIDWRDGKENMQIMAHQMDKLPGKKIISKTKLLSLPKVSPDLFKACYFYRDEKKT